jgi:hypothetical protein
MLFVEIKTKLVEDLGVPEGCETLRLWHFLGNPLKDGSKAVSLRRRPTFTSQEDSWYTFLLKAESTPRPQYGWKY